jgi:hypothetical protein
MGIGIPGGLFFAYLANLHVYPEPKDNYYIWRINFLVPIIFCFIRFVFMTVKYKLDTPDYHLIIEKNEFKALSSLSSIYKDEHINDSMELLKINY